MNIQITRFYLSLLKWPALTAMLIYHYQRFYLLQVTDTVDFMGRLVFPIFAFIFAWNIAQNEGNSNWSQRMFRWLLATACFTQPFYSIATGMATLNIMFSLALGLYVCVNLKSSNFNHLKLSACVLASFLVDYQFIGLGLIISSYYMAYEIQQRNVSVKSVTAYLFVLSLLSLLTSSIAPLGMIVLIGIGLVWKYETRMPRFKHLFYYTYCLHFVLIALLQYQFNIIKMMGL